MTVVQTQTHELTFTETEVRKKYVTWDRGEADREWGCLTLLAEHAPGVAPKPLRLETERPQCCVRSGVHASSPWR